MRRPRLGLCISVMTSYTTARCRGGVALASSVRLSCRHCARANMCRIDHQGTLYLIHARSICDWRVNTAVVARTVAKCHPRTRDSTRSACPHSVGSPRSTWSPAANKAAIAVRRPSVAYPPQPPATNSQTNTLAAVRIESCSVVAAAQPSGPHTTPHTGARCALLRSGDQTYSRAHPRAPLLTANTLVSVLYCQTFSPRPASALRRHPVIELERSSNFKASNRQIPKCSIKTQKIASRVKIARQLQDKKIVYSECVKYEHSSKSSRSSSRVKL
ncbi:hypothetical protein EXIGLDRAFT_317519 [Exidia glandulosa HHB12029]|uniref:Uncharacterized protein n=1 Tax=Exidia glandulosa HHB12029 TaxID=1314781 RepID=A0A165CWE9_EXIGL|nr:hypothetical protein EXIGLDRAFT_317519 [Exidia glandulosa HHB12029]